MTSSNDPHGGAPDDQHGFIGPILAAFAPVHRDGWAFVAGALGAGVVLYMLWEPLGWLLFVTAAAIALFFRDPTRITPVRDGLVIAPADGIVSAIETLPPPVEFALGPEPRQRISTFLSVLDVHVNRTPVAGTIVRALHTPGLFLNAASPAASGMNERRALVVETATGEAIALVQIAGMIARRIVTTVDRGDKVAAGERIGLIRFGSRVDVYLPPGQIALVAIGQRMVAGETVMADLRSPERERPVRAS